MIKKVEKLILFIIFILFFVFRVNIQDATGVGSDFDFIRKESIKLSKGEPIYSRILSGSLTHEEASGGKLPVLLPSVYYFMMLFTGFGKVGLVQSYNNFQFLILVCDVISSLYIYSYLKKRQGVFVGFFGLFFYLFNRWSTNAFFGGYFDPVALMFLLISLYYLGKRNIVSAIFLSCSILFKHFGMFVFPVYFIYWFKKYGIRKSFIYALYVILPIVLTILPSGALSQLVKPICGFVLSARFLINSGAVYP